MEEHLKSCTQSKSNAFSTKFISIFVSSLVLVIILFHIQYSSPFEFSLSARPQRWGFLSQENYSGLIETMTAELKSSVTFLPLVDLRFRETATIGHTRTLVVRWSMKNECLKPARWVEGFDRGDVPYCFEKDTVMRYDLGQTGQENKRKLSDLLRCKSRKMNERGFPIIRLTLLMRRGSRSFKNVTAVTDIFAKECSRVDVNTINKYVLHGPRSSVMEFFPKGWLENAGWMADQSGMKHQGAWWDSIGEECPTPQDHWQCFHFHKDGMVGNNETYFAEWLEVIDQVRLSKVEQASEDQSKATT
ncbi:unnamed protein product [Withania somnifera]